MGFVAILAGGSGLPAAADSQTAASSAPTETVTEELIRLLADRFALSQEDAQRLIKRLNDEKAAQQQTAAAAALTVATPASGQPPVAEPKGRVRVVYLSDSEKKRIREDVKQEVIATAKDENWARPDLLPEWVKNLQIDGDLRLRQEFDFLDPDNSPQFINFQAVNSGPPLNTNPPAGQPLTFPFLNSTEDRQQQRARLRLGLLSNVNDDLSVGLRVSTGNSTNPVSTNQTLGNDFNKWTVVIDQAWMNYRYDPSLSFWAGRIANPFLSTELVWDDDLSFDGIAAQYSHEWNPDIVQHSTAGAFPVQNTDFNFPSTSIAKVNSRDKWLLAVQTGIDWKFDDRLMLKGAAAFYDFVDMEGTLSSPCFAPNTSVACDTDNSRPAFIQKGNTLFSLRDLTVLTSTDPTYQYFGLASPFRILDLNGRVDWTLDRQLHLVVDADVAYNFGFDEDSVEDRVPVNNFGSCPAADPGCNPSFDGGNRAFLLQALVGFPKISQRGQWNALVGYRRLESDAVVDAFTDSDFHLGGTNAKGYYLVGKYGLAENAWLGARWMSTTEDSGAPYAIDVLQIDLNARF